MEVLRDAGAAGAASYEPGAETVVSVGRQGREGSWPFSLIDSFLPLSFLPSSLVLNRSDQAAALSDTRCHIRVNDPSLNLSATLRAWGLP